MGKRLSIGEMRNIAKSLGGKCLSRTYVNNSTPLRWQCSEGHTWKTTAACVKSGRSCPHCAGKIRLTLDALQKVAREQGGLCLSKRYVNARTHLTWECAKGHKWKAPARHVKGGSWCPKCKFEAQRLSQLDKRKRLQELKRIAKS